MSKTLSIAHYFVIVTHYRAKSQEDNKFEIRFKTTSTKGMLLMQHRTTTRQGDYLVIAINRGHVEVSYNLGKQGVEELHLIKSDARVNDGRWHTVIFNRLNTNCYVLHYHCVHFLLSMAVFSSLGNNN